jgi:hypothetical protein
MSALLGLVPMKEDLDSRAEAAAYEYLLVFLLGNALRSAPGMCGVWDVV